MRNWGTPFIINQNCYNIFNRTVENNGLKKSSAANGKGVITFSPLAQGLLTDRYLGGIPSDSRAAGNSVFLQQKDITEDRVKQIRQLNEMARNRGQTLAQFALSWILKDSDITSVLIGASRPSQISDCVKCIDNCGFSKEELEKINLISGV